MNYERTQFRDMKQPFQYLKGSELNISYKVSINNCKTNTQIVIILLRFTFLNMTSLIAIKVKTNMCLVSLKLSLSSALTYVPLFKLISRMQ